jgi:thiol:disulfide interchange protein
VAFSAFSGFMMLAVALWVVWSLWSAAEPAPITDDFLRLLSDSFARDWRNPKTWPWSRVLWAYGFTAVGVALGLVVTIAVSSALASLPSTRRPAAQVETVPIFRVGQ